MERLEEIEARKLELREELETTEDETKVEEINNEVDALNEEVEEIKNHEEEENTSVEMEEKSFEVKEIEMEERKEMNKEEFRNSKEYIDAYAEYMKTNDDKDLRALITTGGYATGNTPVVEVPDFVYDVVKTAWEKENLLSLVRNISVKGNLKVQFEVSGSAAVEHTEGQSAVSEEELILGVVTLTPISVKKWISISDEVYDMRGEEFLRYIYDELTYRIAKKTADTLVSTIASLPQSLSANGSGVYDTVSANKITSAPAIGTIAQAIANLNDETSDITIVMNKQTYGAFKEAQYGANYAQDIFEGARVVFNNTLPAYSAANAGAVYAIVGDFNTGALANYPSGDGIDIKFDDTTLMTADLIRILGRRYVAVAPVQDKAFCLIAKTGVSA